eukprot:3307079-Heterocapsa_arctica.AAC.1
MSNRRPRVATVGIISRPTTCDSPAAPTGVLLVRLLQPLTSFAVTEPLLSTSTLHDPRAQAPQASLPRRSSRG